MGEHAGHPDFQPGNRIAEKVGAWSPRRIAEKCDELSPGFPEWIAEHAPWAAGDEFGPLRLNALRSLAVVELLTESVLRTAAEDGPTAVPTRRFETLLSSLRGEREALAQLGLTPGTKAALAATVVSTEVTLADLAAAGRETSGWRTYAEKRIDPPSEKRGASRAIEPSSGGFGVPPPETIESEGE